MGKRTLHKCTCASDFVKNELTSSLFFLNNEKTSLLYLYKPEMNEIWLTLLKTFEIKTSEKKKKKSIMTYLNDASRCINSSLCCFITDM